jgi:ATP-dependent Clp protease ATP-binding subunit ClpB
VRRGAGAFVAGRAPTIDAETGKFRASVDVDQREAFFRPELLNRIDEMVVYHRLGKAQLMPIVDIQTQRLRSRLHERGITLEITDAAKQQLADEGYDPAYGARPLKRVIQQRLENALANKILAGELGDGDAVRIDAAGGSFTFEKAGSA